MAMSGQGSVYKRCGCVDPVTGRQLGRRCPRLAGRGHGSWYIELELPAAPDGRRCRIRRGGYPSRAAASAVLARLRGPRPGDPGGRVLIAEQAGFGPGYRMSGYVFTNLNGDPMAPDRLSRTFKKLAAEAGLPPVRLHDLRHGAATLALAAGVDLRTVQEQLGHSSIVLTADTYIAVLPEVARAAAEKVAALILRAGCLVPGTGRRRREARRKKRRRRSRPPTPRRSRAHPGRQIGRPRHRSRAVPADPERLSRGTYASNGPVRASRTRKGN
jgi:integrase-like protein